VLLNDQVVFVSCDSSQSNKWYLGTQYIDQSWQLCLGAERNTGLRPRLFAQFGVSSDAFRNVLKGGEFVRLLHKELHGVLAINSSAKDSREAKTTAKTESKHVRLQLLQAEEDAESVHDPASVWQIELDNATQTGGRSIQWVDQVRLKNLLTHQYLTPDGVLSDERSTRTLCRLVEAERGAEAKSSADILLDSFVYLSSGVKWLSVRPSEEPQPGGQLVVEFSEVKVN